MKQQIKTYLAGGFLALALFGTAMAGPLEDGDTAYQRGDYATAMRLWRPLADQGNAAAQTDLGLMYHEGRGVPQDYAQAGAWFRKAADQGNANAQSNLGVMYEHGQGVPQDYAQAAMWDRKAAEQGNAIAQVNLGVSYGHGQGVPQDYVLAHMWFNLAASRASDAEIRDAAIKARDIVAANMTPDQIAEAQRLAREWKPSGSSR